MNLVGCIETLAELIPRIQYRCVLQSLISLYGVLSTTLHLVSETQQMPYIKGFTFPSDITSFLGVNLPSEVKKQKARMLTAKRPTSWLKKLFPAAPEAVSELRKKRGFVTYASALDNHSIPADDIGEPILATTDSTVRHLDVCMKLLYKQAHPYSHLLKKKLCCVKTTLCKYLLRGSQTTRWPRQYRGAWLFRRRAKFS
ncbi:UNVERIFIED_CONTAM: hypothetical protein H355_001779, partial [Colinus virginianus]